MIEPRGGKYAYAICGASIRVVPGTNYVRHMMIFTAADSDDEAYGIGMKAMHTAYPINDGWTGHDLQMRRIDTIAWVARLDLGTVEAVRV